MFASLACDNVETYLQSGNVVFDPPALSDDVASVIASAIKLEFGHDVEVRVFPGPRFTEIVSGNPLLPRGGIDEAFLHLTFLFGKDVSAIPDRELPISGGEEALFRGGHYYLFCPNGYGKTKITNAYFERVLKVSATTRNWKTVCRLNEMLA